MGGSLIPIFIEICDVCARTTGTDHARVTLARALSCSRHLPSTLAAVSVLFAFAGVPIMEFGRIISPAFTLLFDVRCSGEFVSDEDDSHEDADVITPAFITTGHLGATLNSTLEKKVGVQAHHMRRRSTAIEMVGQSEIARVLEVLHHCTSQFYSRIAARLVYCGCMLYVCHRVSVC